MSRRGNKEGSIRHRKDGRWEARIFLGYHPDTGKPRQHSKYFRTRREAQDWLATATHEKNTGSFVEPNVLTVGEWLHRWLRDYAQTNLRPKTWELYHMVLRVHVLPALGKMPLRRLKTGDLQKFYAEKLNGARADGRPGGLAGATIHRIHAILHVALKQAVREQFLFRNPADDVKLPPIPKSEIKPLTVEEMRRFLTEAQKHRLRAAFLLEMGTGLRRGEILALRWEDVNFEAATLAVRHTLDRTAERSGETGRKLRLTEPKTQSSKRVVPLSKNLVLELQAHKVRQEEERSFSGADYHKNGLVFCTEYGKPIEPRNFIRSFKILAARAGVPEVRFHDLRHTFATRLLELNEHPKIVQELLGHSKISTTLDTYSHVDPELKVKATQRLEEAFLSPKKKAG